MIVYTRSGIHTNQTVFTNVKRHPDNCKGCRLYSPGMKLAWEHGKDQGEMDIEEAVNWVATGKKAKK